MLINDDTLVSSFSSMLMMICDADFKVSSFGGQTVHTFTFFGKSFIVKNLN